jgi:hypothetical protein
MGTRITRKVPCSLLKVVSRIFASWNQIGGWLLTLERLRRRVSQRQLRMLEAGKGGIVL